MRVKAHPHRNKIKHGDECAISVKPDNGPVEYHTHVMMTDVTFRVNQNGRKKCLQEGVRNVHAWAIGEFDGKIDLMKLDLEGYKPVQYNPNMGPHFYEMFEGSPLWPVVGAARVYMYKDTCLAKGLIYG